MVTFSRDNAALGISQGAEYRVAGRGRDGRGREVVRLVDEHGRAIQWDPRLSRAAHVNVFNSGERDLAMGDRIQWRLVDNTLGVNNAERGTIERLKGMVARIRWDREGRVQDVDLGKHKNWDHGYAETVYSAQSKTYDRVYVLAPVNSALVTGQNYYTAITRARFGVKLWTEDEKRLVDRLERRSGEKTSSLEGLGLLDRDSASSRLQRHGDRFADIRNQQRADREVRKADIALQRDRIDRQEPDGIAAYLAGRAQSLARTMDRWIVSLVDRGSSDPDSTSKAPPTPEVVAERAQPVRDDRGGGHDR